LPGIDRGKFLQEASRPRQIFSATSGASVALGEDPAKPLGLIRQDGVHRQLHEPAKVPLVVDGPRHDCLDRARLPPLDDPRDLVEKVRPETPA
jgi:hypothetical protein